ncbi:peptide-methionine (S)-S-oxide reductase [Izhakiella australiensis]|uniref:Peptide methionine sulfoxide reductase MsrA n=1 Tax=Izhakiella australiensis TaxID=1926881 RepID=A0A1S8YSH3_9GAMM|nr:peptide-methionine (S)-S-oxide reductase MsrA [Izhakiella australiensis]OON41815.1 peptide-methionine (S)-S-oxide reductase [Izhakiella australiensis]
MKSEINKTQLITQADALPGRNTPMPVAATHAVTGHSMTHVPENMAIALLAMGCFWGVERLFWQQPGVWSTAAGYSGGFTPNPTYPEVCSGQTGHAEAVRIVFDPAIISYLQLLQLFWQNHDPAQGMRQGGDIGTQYRSAIYPLDEAQANAAQASLTRFRQAMDEAGDNRAISTEIAPAALFYYAEDDHQQYLHKNPEGYCGLAGTGICLPPQL